MKHKPRPAIHTEKLLFTGWVGLYVQFGRVSGDLQGRANGVSQVAGVSELTFAFWLCGFVEGGLRKGTMVSAQLSVLGKAVLQLSPWCQTLLFLLVCHWYLSSCYPSTGAQKEWVCVSPQEGSVRGTAWYSKRFFHQFNPQWFLQSEVMGTYLHGTGTLYWREWCEADTPHSWDIPPEVLSSTHGYQTSHFHVSDTPISMDGWGFFNAVVAELPFNSISDGSD